MSRNDTQLSEVGANVNFRKIRAVTIYLKLFDSFYCIYKNNIKEANATDKMALSPLSFPT